MATPSKSSAADRIAPTRPAPSASKPALADAEEQPAVPGVDGPAARRPAMGALGRRSRGAAPVAAPAPRAGRGT